MDGKTKALTDEELKIEDSLEHMNVGIRTCMNHIDTLLRNSELLIKNKRYSASIPISILAIEELGKAEVLSVALSIKKPLPERIWNDLTRGGSAHIKKTTALILSRKLHLKNSTPEEDRQFDEYARKMGIPTISAKRAHEDNHI